MIVITIGLLFKPEAGAQIFIDTSYTAQEMVEDFFNGQCVTVSNVSHVGDASSIGYVDDGQSNTNIGAGILLSTGNVKSIFGPNNNTMAGTGFNLPGDADLDALSGDFTNDAAILEFDLLIGASLDSVQFSYMFGSEEYPEYAPPNGSINDVFGIFVSGPGISGPFSDSSKNYALINNLIPVSINNINASTNSAYYVTNGTGTTGEPQFTDQTVVQYDGFTIPLTSTIPVVSGSTYHFKLVVADASDDILDTGVLLGVNSFCNNGSVSQAMASAPSATGNLSYDFSGTTKYARNAIWDFGDGSPQVSGLNVTHVFPDANGYEVKFIAESYASDTASFLINSVGIDEKLKSEYVIEQSLNEIQVKGVEANSAFSVSVWDLSGRLIQTISNTNFANFYLGSKGTYILKIVGRDSTVTSKVIIK